jgi:PIN domain nuclease of toxin-antitoxin system
MKLLLDTHTFIWFVNGEQLLSENAIKHIVDSSNEKYISVASVWEMAIKISIKKLFVKGGTKKILSDIVENHFSLLNFSPKHFQFIEIMPFHHRDPFDRMLIAQCISEKMTIVTKDPNFLKYDVKILW